MKRDDYEEILRRIGMDQTQNKSKVLQALLKAQGESQESVTFDEIRSRFIQETGGRYVYSSEIYRHLTPLEKDGLILVERTSNPNLYRSNSSILAMGIDILLNKEIDKTEIQLDGFKRSLTILSGIDPEWLARDLIELLVGGPYESKSRSVQGMSQIQALINAEIYSRARTGDTIRVTLDWDFKEGIDEAKLRSIGYALFMKHVRIEFLLHDPERADSKLLRDRLEEYRRVKDNPQFRQYAEPRVTYRKTKTYQFVSLNREGIVLIVSEDPYTGVWIPRSANPKLIDEVINRFDKDFEIAKSFLEISVDQ
ncbi:MAG: hypothetical protein ACFFD3_06405 [Candidatus Thorarchaeota archaeon]